VGGDDQDDDDDDDWEPMEGENGGHVVNECELRLDGSRKTGAALSCSEQGAEFCRCEDARLEFNSAGGSCGFLSRYSREGKETGGAKGGQSYSWAMSNNNLMR
jgi:hypothetical protein